MNPIEKEIHTLWERAGKISGGRNGQEGKGGGLPSRPVKASSMMSEKPSETAVGGMKFIRKQYMPT